MKKMIIILSFILTCGCSIIDETIDNANSTKYGLAKNSVNGYAQAIKNAYTEYRYQKELGTFTQEADATPITIDGIETYLNVKYFGDNVTCDIKQINNGKVNLDNCTSYGYKLKYENGTATKK